MAKKNDTFIYVATYPNETAAQDDYQVIKGLHEEGMVGSYDATVVTKDMNGKVHANKDETATRHGAWGGIAAGACPPPPGTRAAGRPSGTRAARRCRVPARPARRGSTPPSGPPRPGRPPAGS